MYENFYRLRKNPFTLTPDPDFLFLTHTHRDAAAGLSYAILQQKGFAVITGDAGTGKTTLLRSIMESLPPGYAQFSFVLNPALSTTEFFEVAMADFGIPNGFPNKAYRLTGLQQFLLAVHREGKVAVLVVDEAHRLSVEVLEEIRLLTNFETNDQKLLQIVLAGQDELSELLDRRELRQLKQRIAIRLAIKKLTVEEVGHYISHRWGRVTQRELPFTSEAITEIAHCSEGIPRLINAVCDNALLLGFAENAQWIRKKHIGEVAADLRLVAGSLSAIPQGTQSAGPPPPNSPSRDLRPNAMSVAMPVGAGLEEPASSLKPACYSSQQPRASSARQVEKMELHIPRPAAESIEGSFLHNLGRGAFDWGWGKQ